MEDIVFRPAFPTDLPAFCDMVNGLYTEDTSPLRPGTENARNTFAELEKHPEKGRILIFESAGQTAGYAILIHFWSNEYGGNKIIIDEIFVLPEFRGRGFARAFFRYLQSAYPLPAQALELEVTPDNARARKLYESLGFRPAKNTCLIKTLPA
jgi:ribosomal protein S18 acetylase RimI-like enzyme